MNCCWLPSIVAFLGREDDGEVEGGWGRIATLQVVQTNDGEVKRVTRSRGDGRNRVTTGFASGGGEVL